MPGKPCSVGGALPVKSMPVWVANDELVCVKSGEAPAMKNAPIATR